jgi:hypothetical protein
MKLSFLKAGLLLISASLGLTATGSAATATYNPGDIFMGFRADSASGITQSVLVNLGPASQFRDATSSFTVPVGNIGGDLTAVFGTNWHQRTDLFWSVVGANTNATTGTVDGDPARTLYATKPEVTIGVQTTPFNRGSSATQGPPAQKMLDMAAAFVTSQVESGNNSIRQDNITANSYFQFQATSLSFSYFSPRTEGNFANGPAGTALDLFRMTTGSSSLQGTYEGTFTIKSDGEVTFNTSPVPEPSTMLLTATLALGATLQRRRSKKITA